MKIFRMSQGQMIPTNPGAPAAENINIQVTNLNQALPILGKLKGIIEVADAIHEQAAKLGTELGEAGLADQVLGVVQEAIMQNSEFASLVQIGAVGSVQELFNTGVLDQKITFMTRQLQEAQASQGEMMQAGQVQIG